MTADELAEKYLDRLYTFCLRMTGNPADGADLAQDVMLKAIAALPGFRGEADPGTWLFRIAVNTLKNRAAAAAEKWRRGLAPLDGVDGRPLEVAAREPALDHSLEEDEERKALGAALAQVDAQDRAALLLRELEGRSYEDIADILGVPLGTVKSRLHRARAALAAAWEKRHAA